MIIKILNTETNDIIDIKIIENKYWAECEYYKYSVIDIHNIEIIFVLTEPQLKSFIEIKQYMNYKILEVNNGKRKK